MKRIIFIVNLISIFLFMLNAWAGDTINRQRLLMDYNWKFIQNDIKGAEKIDFDDTQWRELNLPHDWSIEGEFNKNAVTGGSGGFLPTGIGWYRKHFNIPDIRENQQFTIEFDGVYMNSDVWINGHHLGKHPYGYSPFYYELTSYIKEGENIIAVKVDNSMQPNSRWYSGSGIYRHVWLYIKGPVHIAQWGTYITTPHVDSLSTNILVQTWIENNLNIVKPVMLRTVILNKEGQEIVINDTTISQLQSGRTKIEQTLTVINPSLWSVDKPSLYTLYSIILNSEKEVDKYVSTFGIRQIEYDKDKGFLLNGKHVKMNGVCLHHDAGCLGAAVPEQAWRRRLELLSDMGCNAIRTAHNPPSTEFLNLCDEMGFLVMDEAFDEWALKKPQIEYGYHYYFKENYESDLRSMIQRDRNHPSIVLWSAGNEILEQGKDQGYKVLQRLMDVFHNEDPTRPVVVANDHIGDTEYPVKLSFLEIQDIVGYNYVDRWHERRELYYSLDRHDHPDWKMIGTENVSIYSVRAMYSLPPGWSARSRWPFDYTNGMIRAEQLWKFTKLHDYVIGDFMWTGIDYLGEAWWPYKNASSGVLDLCGFPKDSYYFYKSQWNCEPMIHLFPHWNWAGKEGQIIPVMVYTNCDSVELLLNGESYGVKSIQFPRQGNSGGWNKYAKPLIPTTTSDLHLSWDIPYEAGNLKAVGKKNGRTVIEKIFTASEPAAIKLTSDRAEIQAGARDIVHIKIEVVDENGFLVPVADNLVEIEVEGEGKLIGTDNGNPRDTSPMKTSKRKTFNGLALAVVQSTLKNGKIIVSAKSKNLESAIINIITHEPEIPINTIESIK